MNTREEPPNLSGCLLLRITPPDAMPGQTDPDFFNYLAPVRMPDGRVEHIAVTPSAAEIYTRGSKQTETDRPGDSP